MSSSCLLRGIAAAALLLALGASPVLAADLPIYKAPPPPPSPPLWTGFYFGANVGAAINSSNGVNTRAGDLFDDVAGSSSFLVPTFFGAAAAASAASNASLNGVGLIGGGQVGYNWQFSNFVAGFEADIQGSTLQGDALVSGIAVEAATGTPVLSTAHLEKSLSYLGTVRGRVGYLVMPTLLVFGTGGLAYGNLALSAAITHAPIDPTGIAGFATGSASFSDARVGWTVGGGFEWMFLPNWSAKAEYLYYDLGSASTTLVLQGGDNILGGPLYASGVQSSSHFSGNIVRAGLNYHFQWFSPATAPAKY